MSKLSKQMIDFCITAYGCLKEDESERACYIKYRNNDERYIDFIMQKSSYYYGKWAVFEHSAFSMSIEESLLEEWLQDSVNKRKERELKSNAS